MNNDELTALIVAVFAAVIVCTFVFSVLYTSYDNNAKEIGWFLQNKTNECNACVIHYTTTDHPCNKTGLSLSWDEYCQQIEENHCRDNCTIYLEN